ncbi:MAG: queuosine precursor transporter [Thermomicrobiales bacterium]
MRVSQWFIVATALFVTCLITANVIAVKLVAIGGQILPAGIVIFPVSYILGDVLTEVYGLRRARLVIWTGFGCNALFVAAAWLGGILPAAGFWDGQPAYERILGFTPRLLAASLVAYLVGEFANAYVLTWLKALTRGRWLWTRTIGSTLVGEGLDSLLFVGLAFAGILPVRTLLITAATQWLIKTGYEALATPLTYLAVGFFRHAEGRADAMQPVGFSPMPLHAGGDD